MNRPNEWSRTFPLILEVINKIPLIEQCDSHTIILTNVSFYVCYKSQVFGISCYLVSSSSSPVFLVSFMSGQDPLGVLVADSRLRAMNVLCWLRGRALV